MPRPRIKSAASATKAAMNRRKRKPSIKAARARNKIKRAGALSKSARRTAITRSKQKRLASFIKSKMATLKPKKKAVVKKTAPKKTVEKKTTPKKSVKRKPVSASASAKLDMISPRAYGGASASTKMTPAQRRRALMIKDKNSIK